jgi:hypothetical protein
MIWEASGISKRSGQVVLLTQPACREPQVLPPVIYSYIHLSIYPSDPPSSSTNPIMYYYLWLTMHTPLQERGVAFRPGSLEPTQPMTVPTGGFHHSADPLYSEAYLHPLQNKDTIYRVLRYLIRPPNKLTPRMQ